MHMVAFSPYVRLSLTVGVLATLVALGYAIRAFSSESLETIEVVRTDVRQEISVTGKAIAVEEVELAFQAGGTISEVFTQVGSLVVLGDVLARLDEREMRASLQQAEALRDAEAAKLADMRNGIKPEDIAILEAKLEGAISARDQAHINLINAIRDAYTAADDALRNKADQFVDNAWHTPVLRIIPPDFQLVQRIETGRRQLETVLEEWKRTLDDTTDEERAADALSALRIIQSYLTELSLAANASHISGALSAATLATYRNDLSLARSQVDGAITELQAAIASHRLASTDVAVTLRTLESEKAGSTQLSLEAQSARVTQYEAQAASIRAQLTKARLVSPISGVVTQQRAKIGQVAAAGTPLVSVISNADLEIEAYVPEISIGKVEIGNRATVVFDAYPDDEFLGTVAAIDPAETVIEGVANYKVTIALAHKDTRLRRGFTADVRIIRAEAEDVLAIPEYVLVHTSAGAAVEKIVDGMVTESLVQLGLRGDNGYVEILEGLAEGDRLVIP